MPDRSTKELSEKECIACRGQVSPESWLIADHVGSKPAPTGILFARKSPKRCSASLLGVLDPTPLALGAIASLPAKALDLSRVVH